MELLSYIPDRAWWEVLLMIAGIAGVGTVLLNLFSSIGDRVKLRTTAPDLDAGSDQFLLSLSHVVNTPIEEGGEIEILNNGKEFLPRLLQDLRQAEKTINVTTYIWQEGKMSDEIVHALIDRLQKGVEVRILRDGWGGLYAPRKQLRQLKRLGAKIRSFRSPEFGKLTRLHRRSHRRAIVIDGRVGYTGGMAIADKWLGDAEDKNHWRDLMFRLSGTLARSLQSAFADLWAGTHGEILAGPQFFPLLPSSTPQPLRFVALASSPSDDTLPLPKFLWLSIMSAKKSLYLATPYFVPDENIFSAIRNRAKKGVDVRLLVPNGGTVSLPARWASQGFYDRLLRAGVRIFEYQPTMYHGKMMIVDGAWSVIGSYNLDIRSKDLNEENVLGIQNSRFALDLQAVYLRDLQRSEEITLASWRKRSLLRRGAERLASFFAEQF